MNLITEWILNQVPDTDIKTLYPPFFSSPCMSNFQVCHNKIFIILNVLCFYIVQST